MIFSYIPKLSHQSYMMYFRQVITFSVLLALGSQISFMLPVSPVPFTLQTDALIIISFLGGKKIAVGAVLVYFLQGIMGLPVFAGASSGIWAFFSFSGGYLLGFLPAAWIMGVCAERNLPTTKLGAIFTVMAGLFCIYVCGLLRLSMLVPAKQLLSLGLYPFVWNILFKLVATPVFISLPGIKVLHKEK